MKDKETEIKINKEEKKDIKKDKKDNKLNEKLEFLKNELASEKEKNLRAQAELINFKRRKEEETANLFKYANEEVVSSLLPVIDNFERAIILDDNDLTDELSKFLSGFKMIYGNLVEILNRYEVKEIEASGLEFDPNFHQAIITEKDENKPAGVVLEVLQKGYTYKERVIRPAMVKVNE